MRWWSPSPYFLVIFCEWVTVPALLEHQLSTHMHAVQQQVVATDTAITYAIDQTQDEWAAISMCPGILNQQSMDNCIFPSSTTFENENSLLRTKSTDGHDTTLTLANICFTLGLQLSSSLSHKTNSRALWEQGCAAASICHQGSMHA